MKILIYFFGILFLFGATLDAKFALFGGEAQILNQFSWPRTLWIISLIFLLAILSLNSIFGGTKSEENSQNKGKVFYISALNVCAALGVVFLHANSIFWANPRPQGATWISANFIETLFYWPVPIFFMITGATLMEYRERYDTREFLKKRLLRTFVPFLAWSVIACAFYVLYLKKPMDHNILHIVENIFKAKYMGIYWFFPPLFAIYLSLPLFGFIIDKISAFRYAVPVGVLTICVLPLVCNLLGISYNGALKLPIAGGFLFFVMTGFYLSRVNLSKKERIIIYICGILGWLMHFLGTFAVSENATSVIKTFKGYANLPSFLQSVAVFVFFKYFFAQISVPSRAQKLIFSASTLTFGIYLIHKFLLIVIVKEFNIDNSTLSWRIFGALGVFILSGIIIFALKKIPILNKIVP